VTTKQPVWGSANDIIDALFFSVKKDQEWGLGDSGFCGLDTIDGLRVITPPTERRAAYKLFSSIRVRVENRIADFKDFAICRDRIRLPPSNKERILDFHHKA
jgi:hypothetical protein